MKSKGSAAIALGLICLISAAALTGYNIYIQDKAGELSDAAVKELNAVILSQNPDYTPLSVSESESESMAAEAETETKTSENSVSDNITIPDDTDSTETNEVSEEGEKTEIGQLYGICETQAIRKDYELFPEIEMPAVNVNDNSYIGVLRIQSLGLELPIISEWNYSYLSVAPCRYSGSAYLDNLVLCGHNYTSHFGKLDRLNYGDRIIFTDMDGNEFLYEVSEIEVLNPTDVDDMTNSGYALTLFTCNMSGKARITVRCSLISD